MLRSCDKVDLKFNQRHRQCNSSLMTTLPKATLYHYPGSVWSAVGNMSFVLQIVYLLMVYSSTGIVRSLDFGFLNKYLTSTMTEKKRVMHQMKSTFVL